MKFRFATLTVVAAFLLSAFFVPQVLHAQDSPQRIEIVAKRFDFTPGEITVKKGVPVTLVVTSKDVDHSLKIKELNVNVVAKKGSSGEATFTPTQTGTFVGRCGIFCGSGHGSMKFTLNVTE
jgi:cytochrome c oxidase subunit II